MANPRLCSIPDCGKPVRSIGLCCSHYFFLRRRGDALAPRRKTVNGARAAWIKDHVNYQGDDCISWPFCHDRKGYARYSANGLSMTASRYMCIQAHGEPPEGYEAAHSCGNGNGGCLNPRHLRWATRSENHMDKIGHGTATRGSQQVTSKLTEDDVREIRRLRGEMSSKAIAAIFNVHPGTIDHIFYGESWGWLDAG